MSGRFDDLPDWFFKSYPEDSPGRYETIPTVFLPFVDIQLTDRISVAQFEAEFTPQIDMWPGAYLDMTTTQRICLRCEQVHEVEDECDDDNR